MNSNSLRILMTDPHLQGGGQVRYVTNLARELGRLSHTVILGCKPSSVLVQVARDLGCEVLNRFPFRGGLRPAAWGRDLRNAMRALRELELDIIHVSGSQDHWALALANRMLGRPVCLVRTRHNTYRVHDGWANRVLNQRWTDYQIVVCEMVRHRLAAQRAFDARRMCSIHNGVDAEAFQPDPAARTEARRHFGYSDEEVVVGIAARLVPAKGHTFLFQAVARLLAAQPRLRVLVLGQGGLEHALREEAQALGIAHAVQFAGFRDDMAWCTQAFDIGAQPSIDCDTSSFSLKEQMAAGKPVVASDYGGLTEIVSDGVEGFVVPSGTVEPLAEALARLAADSSLRARMGEAGRARVLREFTVEIFARRTAEAYQEAIEWHARRQPMPVDARL